MANAADLSEFEELSKPRRVVCSVAQALSQVGDEAEILRAALAADHITHSAVAKWLGRREIKISAHTVARHSRRECACDD